MPVLVEKRILGEVDVVSTEDVRGLASIEGPCVSLFMPTHRHGADTLQGPVRLRNLIDRAANDLRAADFVQKTVDEVLYSPRALLDDGWFWQHQGDGLALFAAPDFCARYRLPASVAEELVVARSFRVRPLVPLLARDGVFFILALSQNSIRLFEATHHSIGELDSGGLPCSMDEALAHEDPERQLQMRRIGRPDILFHGHGAGAEVDKEELERYFRVVDRHIADRIGSTNQPLVLACVNYYLPIFRKVSQHPNLLDAAVEGNPEHRSPAELHASGWELVEEQFAAHAASQAMRYRNAAGSGRAVTAIGQVVTAAWQGRVDTLFVGESPAHWGRLNRTTGEVKISSSRSPFDEDLVDRALLETVLHDGQVLPSSGLLKTAGVPVAALLRY